jgi:hypothetical protein
MLPTADVDGRAPLGVRLGLPQHLVGHGRGVPLAEQEEANRYTMGLPSVQPK